MSLSLMRLHSWMSSGWLKRMSGNAFVGDFMPSSLSAIEYGLVASGEVAF